MTEELGGRVARDGGAGGSKGRGALPGREAEELGGRVARERSEQANRDPHEEQSARPEVGQVIAEAHYTFTRDNLVRYAGASGDFNPIHYRDDVAQSVGLAGVLAHGMLTMGVAVQPVVDWAGDPGRIVDYQVRFTRPVPVDAADGAVIDVVATIGAIEGGVARVDLTVTFSEKTVLGKAQLRVRL